MRGNASIALMNLWRFQYPAAFLSEVFTSNDAIWTFYVQYLKQHWKSLLSKRKCKTKKQKMFISLLVPINVANAKEPTTKLANKL